MPVRFKRTLDFLSRGKLHLKDTVKVVAIFYNGVGSSSSGLRDFMKENLAQIQYKNPRVQIVAFKDTKAPAQITVYHKDNICNKAFIDCRYKGSRHIMEELTTTSGKTEAQLKREQEVPKYNPANFGNERTGHFCACKIPGQVPCPSIVPILNVDHPWKRKGQNN